MKKIYCMFIKKRMGSTSIKISDLISPVHNYQDEKCTGTKGNINKCIWQNTVNWLRLVD